VDTYKGGPKENPPAVAVPTGFQSGFVCHGRLRNVTHSRYAGLVEIPLPPRADGRPPPLFSFEHALQRILLSDDGPLADLVEVHPHPVILAPDDVTRNSGAVRLEEKVETFRDFLGVSNLKRCP